MAMTKQVAPCISDSERLVALQRDMILLRQQLASMTAKNANVLKDSIFYTREVEELKLKVADCEWKCSSKTEDQQTKGINDRLQSLIGNVESRFNELNSSIQLACTLISVIKEELVDVKINESIQTDKITNLSNFLYETRKEVISAASHDLSQLKKEIQAQIAALPVPIVPLTPEEIKAMIIEIFVPIRNEAKDAADRSRDVKMELALLKKKLNER